MPRNALGLLAHRLLLALCAGLVASSAATAPPQTVCTITLNSADEKEAFAARLNPQAYRFIELVEPGRPDWLARACRASQRCEVLIVSGHFDGDAQFFSDRLDQQDFLSIAELERASCSESCPALFARLREVYLFGCNTLNPRPLDAASVAAVRSLVREGRSAQEAERRLQELSSGHGQSSRERMRRIFKGVPVIYGFPAGAPLGPVAAAALDRALRAGSGFAPGRGTPSRALLEPFAPFGMSSTAGTAAHGAEFDLRLEHCSLVDERLSTAHQLAVVHTLLQRDGAWASPHLERIQALVAGLDAEARGQAGVADRLAAIAADQQARARFLAGLAGAEPGLWRVRMLELAHALGWLSAAERRRELVQLLEELLARQAPGLADIELACSLADGQGVYGALGAETPAEGLAQAALRACLGSARARQRVLAALSAPDEAEVQIAQAYLRRRPIDDAAELGRVAARIVQMEPSDAQVRALETLGRHYLSDRAVLALLVQQLSQSRALPVRAAIAGILLRAELRALPRAQITQTLLEQGLLSAQGGGVFDALWRRLQTP